MNKNEIEIVTDFLNLMNNLESTWVEVCSDISRADLEVSDIRHEIEFENFDEARGYNLASDLKLVCQNRREAKNHQDILRYVKDFSEKNEDSIVSLQRTLNQMKKAAAGQTNKKYTPRIRVTPVTVDAINTCSMNNGSGMNEGVLN